MVLLLSSAFFSVAEDSFKSLTEIRVRHLAKKGVKGADIVFRLLDNPTKVFTTLLVGKSLFNIGAIALATFFVIQYFNKTLIGIATGIITIVVLMLNEIIPKALGVDSSEKIALKVAKIVLFLTILLSPVVYLVINFTNLIAKFFGGSGNNKQHFITEEELKTMVEVSHEEGVLEGEEKQLIYNVFQFGDSQVKDAMLPRRNIVALGINTPYEKIISTFREEQFSRIPVYQDNIDNIVGILYIKDLIFYEEGKETFDIKKYMREPYFTFEYKKNTELLEELREKRIPLAIVLDEYGGTAGIIAMEDLVEEIVGEIEDEYDEMEKDIEIIKEDEYIVHGGTRVTIFKEITGINIETKEFDSIGGFVLGQFGRLPQVGETIKYNNIDFKIESVDKNRIDKLRVII